MTTHAQSVRALPAWLSATIIVASLGAGSWAVYRYLIGGPPDDEVVVLDRGPDDGVKPLDSRHWRVQSGNTGLRVTLGRDDRLDAVLYLVRYDFLTQPQSDALVKGRRIAMDKAMADAIALSDEQLSSLRGLLHKAFQLELSAADRDRLIELFRAWQQAPDSSKSNRESALLKALEESGGRAEAAARPLLMEAASAVQAALTPDQWHKFDEIDK